MTKRPFVISLLLAICCTNRAAAQPLTRLMATLQWKEKCTDLVLVKHEAIRAELKINDEQFQAVLTHEMETDQSVSDVFERYSDATWDEVGFVQNEIQKVTRRMPDLIEKELSQLQVRRLKQLYRRFHIEKQGGFSTALLGFYETPVWDWIEITPEQRITLREMKTADEAACFSILDSHQAKELRQLLGVPFDFETIFD